ncbi:MAG: helix-turn-helix domain-containing protein [Leucobacter sp.]
MTPAEPEEGHAIHCRLDELLAERGMTLTELAERVGVSIVNLSVLKNDRAKAIRFTTLTAICHALECDVGDLLTVARPANEQ